MINERYPLTGKPYPKRLIFKVVGYSSSTWYENPTPCLLYTSTVPQVRKSFQAMALCRTSLLGGHVEVCPECGEVRVSYNSCRDRHCPKCQHKERETWIEMRQMCIRDRYNNA